jgi:hypothetical protein
MKTKNITLREQFQTKNIRNEDKMDTSNTHIIIYLLHLSGASFEPRGNKGKTDTPNANT